ncbi:hypothetical protein ACWIDS_12215 [Dietzia maris]
MSYTIGLISRWDTTALTAAGDANATRRATAQALRTSLADGRDTLAEGWSGVAADAVLDAAETEKSHVTKLVGGLEDLTDALAEPKQPCNPQSNRYATESGTPSAPDWSSAKTPSALHQAATTSPRTP